MTTSQRTILRLTLAAIGLMCLVPPWHGYTVVGGIGRVGSAGYSPVFWAASPWGTYQDALGTSIDVERLLVQATVALCIGAVAWLTVPPDGWAAVLPRLKRAWQARGESVGDTQHGDEAGGGSTSARGAPTQQRSAEGRTSSRESADHAG